MKLGIVVLANMWLGFIQQLRTRRYFYSRGSNESN